MMYPFMTLEDDTEIVHSHMLDDGRVKVYIERPDAELGFRHATCFLPGYSWDDVEGFSDGEIAGFQEIIESTAQQIMKRAEKEIA